MVKPSALRPAGAMGPRVCRHVLPGGPCTAYGPAQRPRRASSPRGSRPARHLRSVHPRAAYRMDELRRHGLRPAGPRGERGPFAGARRRVGHLQRPGVGRGRGPVCHRGGPGFVHDFEQRLFTAPGGALRRREPMFTRTGGARPRSATTRRPLRLPPVASAFCPDRRCAVDGDCRPPLRCCPSS